MSSLHWCPKMRMPASSDEWMDHALVDRRVDVEVYRTSAGSRHDRPVRPAVRSAKEKLLPALRLARAEPGSPLD